MRATEALLHVLDLTTVEPEVPERGEETQLELRALRGELAARPPVCGSSEPLLQLGALEGEAPDAAELRQEATPQRLVVVGRLRLFL